MVVLSSGREKVDDWAVRIASSRGKSYTSVVAPKSFSASTRSKVGDLSRGLGVSSKRQVLRHQRLVKRCFRCCEQGHFASLCRNALVCFRCRGLGHRAAFCPRSWPIEGAHLKSEETLIPSPVSLPKAPMAGFVEIPYDNRVVEEVCRLRHHAVAKVCD